MAEESFIMPILPEEIITDILSLLPAKSIIRFRCVCKNWCSKLFKDPKFVKLHHNHAILNNKFISLLKTKIRPMYSVDLCHTSTSSLVHNEFVVEIDSPLSLAPADEFFMMITSEDRVYIYGSCNGLILMNNLHWSDDGDYPEGRRVLILWNPSTKEIKEIPQPIDPRISSARSIDIDLDEVDPETLYWARTEFGFGYSPTLDDYKIVKATMYYKGDGWLTDGCDVKVYSLRSNSWNIIPDLIPYDLFLGGKAVKPVMYNGDLHWIGSSCASLNKGRELSIASSIVIISYDMENDTFIEVPVISELQESLCYDHTKIQSVYYLLSGETFLGIFHGCLSVVQGGELDSARNNDVGITIWVMMEYGVRESWSKMFTITNQSMVSCPIQYSKMTVLSAMNGLVLFLKDKTSLVLYDPEHETASVMNICGLLEDWSYVESYVESLASLNSGTYLHLFSPQWKHRPQQFLC